MEYDSYVSPSTLSASTRFSYIPKNGRQGRPDNKKRLIFGVSQTVIGKQIVIIFGDDYHSSNTLATSRKTSFRLGLIPDFFSSIPFRIPFLTILEVCSTNCIGNSDIMSVLLGNIGLLSF